MKTPSPTCPLEGGTEKKDRRRQSEQRVEAASKDPWSLAKVFPILEILDHEIGQVCAPSYLNHPLNPR